VRAVAIVGSSGSGKTTLARVLSDRLGLEHIEIDSVYHQPGWAGLETNEFRRRVQQRIDEASSGWVADGNYNGQLAGITQRAADTIVWLDLAKATVMRRVTARTIRRAVRREELWNGNREPLSNFFRWDPNHNIMRWTWVHFDRYRRRYDTFSVDGTWAHADVVRLCGTQEVDAWLAART
jgi:adenylate kinase family enzyme